MGKLASTISLKAVNQASRTGFSGGNNLLSLLSWLNEFLQLGDDTSSKKIENLKEFGDGFHACQVLDACTKGQVRMESCRVGTKLTEGEKLANWKQFQHDAMFGRSLTLTE